MNGDQSANPQQYVEVLTSLRELAQAWVQRCPNDPKDGFGFGGASVSMYADLAFAFGYARLGERDKSTEILPQCRAAIEISSDDRRQSARALTTAIVVEIQFVMTYDGYDI